jgi:hypothetical protein
MRAVSYTSDIVRTVQEHWIAITPPYPCKCGHDHYGRQLVRDGQTINQAPFYGFCDDEECDCQALRRVSMP